MINARGGANVNPNQMQQRQQVNNFQGHHHHHQQQQHQRHSSQQQQHVSHNHQNNNNNNTQGMNRNPQQQQQNRPQRPMNPQQSNSHSAQHHSQQMRPSNQTNHPSRPNSGMNSNQAQNKPNQQQQQQQQQPAPANNGPPLPPVLPKGWKRDEIIRTKGISAGLVDVVYIPQPNSELSNSDIVGKKFRTKIELRKCFAGSKYDTTLLDFKTGKLSQIAWRRQRRMKSIAANPAQNYASAAKYDLYLNLPVRQNNTSAAAATKQNVFYVTNNHKNDPTPATVLEQTKTSGPNGQTRTNEKPKPIQLFWEFRFSDLKAMDTNLLDLENINEDFELENIPKFKNFPTSDETVMRSVAASWYLNQNKALVGQDKDFSKNARIFIDREQPLIPQTTIKEDDVKQQEARVKEMRKQLQQALEDLDSMDQLDAKEELNMINDDRMEDDKEEEKGGEEEEITDDNNNNNNNDSNHDEKHRNELVDESQDEQHQNKITTTDMKSIECN